MKKLIIFDFSGAPLKWILMLFFSNLAFAELTNLPTAPSEIYPSFLSSIEFDYRLFSPEILFKLGGDLVVMTPKEAGQPGLRYSRENLSLSINNSFFSSSSKSGGFDFAYSWDNSYVQAYHSWASGYRVRLNPDSNNKVNLGSREDMKGTSEGLLFLKGFDEASRFSMMTQHGPRDQQSLETPLQYIYQILVDRSIFSDSSAFAPGSTVRRKERVFLIPGLGAMMSESTPAGYVFTSCSLGIGVVQEKMTYTTGVTEDKTDGAYDLSCILNLVLQKSRSQLKAGDSRWYGGMSGNVQMIQPFDKSLLAQRLFLVSVFVGTQF